MKYILAAIFSLIVVGYFVWPQDNPDLGQVVLEAKRATSTEQKIDTYKTEVDAYQTECLKNTGNYCGKRKSERIGTENDLKESVRVSHNTGPQGIGYDIIYTYTETVNERGSTTINTYQKVNSTGPLDRSHDWKQVGGI